MSQRDGYEHGVPAWIAGAHPDPEAAARFYTELLGWEADPRGDQLVCTLGGRDVAGFIEGDDSAWRTGVWVDSVDEVAERASSAGGSVIAANVLADPAGAVFSVFEPSDHRGAQVVNQPGAWAMSALSTPDLEGANAFYNAVFGWEPDSFTAGDMEFTMWRLPGFVGGEPEQPVPRDLVAVGQPGDTPLWAVDFWVDDVDATAGRADELGGSVLQPAQDGPVGRTAILADPQGAPFSISRVVPA